MLHKILFHKHLEKEEKILYAIHKHWVFLLKPLIITGFFGILVPWSLYAIGFNANAFFWIAVVWSGLATILLLYEYFDWYSDAWLLTTMSLMAVEWNGFFHNASTRVDYQTIEGLTYEIKGFWPTVLRYGNISLNVVSGNNAVMQHAKNPKKAELMLAKLQEEVLSSKNFQDATGLKALLSDLVAHHLRQK